MTTPAALGLVTPDSDDLLADGAEAISTNAEKVAEIYDRLRTDIGVELRDDTTLADDVAAAWVLDDGSIAMRLYRDGTLDATLRGTPASDGIVAYGDSTTYGADLTDPATERWTTLLAAQLARPIENRGLSGARAEEVATMTGGLAVRATVDGGTIPASGFATLTDLSVDPWRAGVADGFDVVALTDAGDLVPGQATRAGGTTRRFARTTPGDLIPATSIDMRSTIDRTRTLFLGIGTNNLQEIAAGRQTLDELLAWHEAITSVWTGPIIVWGVLDRGYNERPSTPTGQLIDGLETWLAQRYGDRYTSVRAYLASPLALADATRFQPSFVPTSDDLTAQAEGRIPPSFRYHFSSVHLNALGHQLQARYLHRYMLLRGLI